jgi:tRNA pseudouridine38-40 synthase
MLEQDTPARMLVCVVEYDGTRYHGFQLQADKPTIQGEIERALEKLTGEKSRVIGASRTDAGVHAKGQVIGFQTRSALKCKSFMDGLNYHLLSDIAIKATRKVDINFKLRREAKNREYCYRILDSSIRSPLEQGRAYQVAKSLNVYAMSRASQALIGTHDFASFTQLGGYSESTVRTVYDANVRRQNDLVLFDIKADSFLQQQIRRTVGALIRVGMTDIATEDFGQIVEAKKYGLAGPTAPPYGLYLTAVNYDIDLYEEEK